MSLLDCWIYAKPAEWDSLATGPDEAPFSQSYADAKTGRWKTFAGGYEVYNVLGTESEIQDILDALTDVARVYAWGQGDGYDDASLWPSDITDIIAVMKDHPDTYAPDGNPLTYTPATMERPNWGHMFAGQEQRLFAGDFNDDFNEDFF